jgi:putative ABC transport system permease protein
MGKVFKIALRNLLRYKRRTLLTASLIAVGVILMIVFGGVASSFKNGVIGILTDSNLADIQIHKRGYLSSIDNLPLNLVIKDSGIKRIEDILKKSDQVKAFSKRIRFGAMISNFEQTTNIRLTAVYPELENQTCPDLAKRIESNEEDSDKFVKPGEIVVPVNIAKGLKLELGSDVVLVANNKDGSVNGITLRVGGLSENILGPTGKDGYLHMDDAKTLLRIEGEELTQIAVKLKSFHRLDAVYEQLEAELIEIKDKSGNPAFEVSTWEQLSPFTSVAQIVDLLIIVVRVILISIVLISVLNVMMMSVYERVSEVGTIASIGTPPGRILSLFLVEGFSLGFISSIAGSILGIAILFVIKVVKLNFTFGRMDISLSPAIPFIEVLLTILIVVIISIISTLQPAVKASKLEPVEALRHV